MGQPTSIRQVTLDVLGKDLEVVALWVGNPQCVVLGALRGFQREAALGRVRAIQRGTPGDQDCQAGHGADSNWEYERTHVYFPCLRLMRGGASPKMRRDG